MILFTADWHIKLGQKNVPVSWAKNRYRLFFEQIHKLEEEVTLHIIGGDLFDRLPTMEELHLYFEFVAKVNVDTIIFDGNHEATKKNETFFEYLKEATSKINPLVRVVTEPMEWEDSDVEFSILPYCYLHRKGSIEELRPIVLFTHVRGEIPPHVKPEVDLDRFNKFPLVFAGDLHSHSNTQRNIVYPGSPMTTSFHRNKVKTGYILISGEAWDWREFKLPQLIRKTVSSPEEMVPTEYDHTIYELEGDLHDLSSVENSELLDKKVIRRDSEAKLILEKDMDISEELAEYLLFIMNLSEDKTKDIVAVFNDYSKEANI